MVAAIRAAAVRASSSTSGTIRFEAFSFGASASGIGPTPSSSSHALIGGVVGSSVAAAGLDAVFADGLIGKVLIPAIIAPLLAFTVAGVAIGLIYRVVGK